MGHLPEELNFYGIVVHATAEYKNEFNDDTSIYPYSCVFKNGIAKHLMIAPITFLTESFDNSEFNQLKKSVSRLGLKSSESIQKYIDNTLIYLDHLRSETINRLKNEEIE